MIMINFNELPVPSNKNAVLVHLFIIMQYNRYLVMLTLDRKWNTTIVTEAI